MLTLILAMLAFIGISILLIIGSAVFPVFLSWLEKPHSKELSPSELARAQRIKEVEELAEAGRKLAHETDMVTPPDESAME